MENYSDYALVQLIKEENNTEAVIALFERYEKLVYKIYKKFFGYREYIYPKEDYVQEAFIILYEAVRYVQNKKIENSENWRLYSVYSWYLLSLARKIHLDLNSSYKLNVPLEDYLDVSTGEIDIDFKVFLDSFLNDLPPIQKILFQKKHLMTKNYSISELEKEIHIAKSSIYYFSDIILKQLKEKFFQ